jgi:hypothetical protein
MVSKLADKIDVASGQFSHFFSLFFYSSGFEIIDKFSKSAGKCKDQDFWTQ